MYKVGDLIIYSSTGVCRIADITARNSEGVEQEQLFYVLTPLYQNYNIFTPINNAKIFMRPIITRNEAERLIDMIPTIRAEAYHNRAISQLAEHYKESLKTHDCSDLLELCMSIYTKRQVVEQQNRKFGAVDEKFMKRAEELLFGELAAALDKEQVPVYITARITEERK
jgi:Transcriptional regulators, similar to M. xanthus CarD